MIKMIAVFLIVFFLFFFGLAVFRKMSGMERLVLTKLVFYSIIVAVMTTAFLTALVLFF